ncbi:hypothetical protein [Sphingomonas sp. 1P08PE]|uniref:hypothetical protein n=1 Tax=Sphingomonas sp. 1P08PE TaxID=554122 RepID=UPI00399F716F
MVTYDLTNEAKGARGVGDIFVEAGATRKGVTLNDDQVAEVERFGLLKISAGPLDHDEDGEKGGSKPDSPPALSGKTKAELLDIARAEGVEVEEGATNDDIRSAIELHREG